MQSLYSKKQRFLLYYKQVYKKSVSRTLFVLLIFSTLQCRIIHAEDTFLINIITNLTKTKKLMRKVYSFLLMLALTCISTVTWGQTYEASITSDPENNYFSGSKSFPVADIISGLGLADEAALEALINGEGNNNVYLKTADDETNTYTGNHNEFWMNADGTPQGYGDAGTCWYAGLYYDPAGIDPETQEPYESEFYVKVGQMPNFFKKVYTDSDLSCTLYLINGNGRLEFNVSLHVNAAPQPTEVYLTKLTVVKDYTLPLNFTLGKSYEGKTYSATLEGVYEALGTTAEEFDAKASAQTYTQTVKTTVDPQTEETSYELIDSLSHPEDAAGGAWFGRYANYDEQEGKDIPLEINAPKTWGTGANTFYTQEITLAEGEYSIVSGQFGGTFTSTEDNDYTYLYLVNGEKAVRIKVQVSLEEAPTIDPDQMVEVGSVNVAVKADVDNSYTQKSFTIDMAAICEALGCTIDDIDDVYTMSNGAISNDHNEDSGGYYYNEEGVITAWGAGAAFFIAKSNLPEGKYGIGQRQGYFTDITEPVTCTAQLVFQYLQNYYSVNVSYTVSQPEKPDIDPSDWTQAFEDDYTAQLIKAEGYGQDPSSKTTIDLDAIVEALGTDDLRLFGEKWTDGVMEYSDAWSCDPNPGFWMAEDGISVATWAATCAYGMSYADGVITYYVHPDTQNEAGATFESNFYLVNVQEGKYAKITLNIVYVDERGDIVDDEPLGTQDVNIVLSTDTYNDENGQYYSPVIDWATVFTTLEMAPEDFEGATWMVQKKADKFVNFGGTGDFDMETGTMDSKGLYTADGENATFAIGLNISDAPTTAEDFKFTLSLFGEDPEEGVLYATKIALKTEKGFYVFNIVGAGEETMTGIKGISYSKKATGKFVDFSGREVPASAKGFTISEDGTKRFNR